VTASTGIAASHIGGQTIHSASGRGVAQGMSVRDIAEKIKMSRPAQERWTGMKVLIIDEGTLLADIADEQSRC
jgi:ATP-dependent DNA helicase PIF1